MDGQLKLKQARVLMIGAGGLGAPLGLYLAAAGVGHLGIVDFDVVDFTNLQRQVTFSNSRRGKDQNRSGESAARRDESPIEITTYETRLNSSNALELFRDYDIMVDGTDNFPTRYLVNDACVLLGKPNVYGSIFRFEGQVSVFGMPEGLAIAACIPNRLRRDWCRRARKAASWACCPESWARFRRWKRSSWFSAPAIRWWAGLLLFDALAMRFRELKLKKNPDCPLCGENRTITKLIDYEEFCGIRGEEAPAAVTDVPEMTPVRIEAAPGPRRRSVYPRRARAARISNLQSQWLSDSARRSAEARERTG